MIPEKKKTAEEIAALREGLGIHIAISEPEPATPEPATPEPVTPVPLETIAEETPITPAAVAESIIHLDLQLPPGRPQKIEAKLVHSLRKRELPLAPAPASTHRTELPITRHDTRDITEIRKREALAALQQPGIDPVAHLRSQIASPFLYGPGYLLSIAAAVTAYKSFHYITPAGLLAIASLIMIFIALRKPRSRHHSALLFIVVFLILVFGSIHYAPLFINVP